MSILVAIGVIAEGTKEDKASWQGFLRSLKQRGLKGVKLVVGDKCLGLVESLAEFYPEASYQRCVVHFYRNLWSLVPASKVRLVAAMLKAIHASEDREAARVKAAQVVIKRQIRRRTRAVEAFPDGNSALVLVCARLRHIVGTQWGRKRNLDMARLHRLQEELQPETQAA